MDASDIYYDAARFQLQPPDEYDYNPSCRYSSGQVHIPVPPCPTEDLRSKESALLYSIPPCQYLTPGQNHPQEVPPDSGGGGHYPAGQGIRGGQGEAPFPWMKSSRVRPYPSLPGKVAFILNNEILPNYETTAMSGYIRAYGFITDHVR